MALGSTLGPGSHATPISSLLAPTIAVKFARIGKRLPALAALARREFPSSGQASKDLEKDDNFLQWKQFDSAFLSTLDHLAGQVNSSYLNTGVLYHAGIPAGERDYNQYVFKPELGGKPQIAPAPPEGREEEAIRPPRVDEPPTPPTPPKLNELQLRVMRVFAHQPEGIEPNALGGLLGIHGLRAKDVLESLRALGLARRDENYISGTTYALSDGGRRFLVDGGFV